MLHRMLVSCCHQAVRWLARRKQESARLAPALPARTKFSFCHSEKQQCHQPFVNGGRLRGEFVCVNGGTTWDSSSEGPMPTRALGTRRSSHV